MASKSVVEVLFKHEYDIDVLNKRTFYILDITKNQREDIETLFKYIKYVTIYAITINVIIIGILLCLIIAN